MIPDRTASETDKAYAAGFVDGEGSVNIYQNQNGYRYIRVCIGQMSIEPLMFIQSFWGGVFTQSKSTRLWMLNINGHKGSSFLRDVFPYLIVKRAAAERCLLEYGVRVQGQAVPTEEGPRGGEPAGSNT